MLTKEDVYEIAHKLTADTLCDANANGDLIWITAQISGVTQLCELLVKEIDRKNTEILARLNRKEEKNAE